MMNLDILQIVELSIVVLMLARLLLLENQKQNMYTSSYKSTGYSGFSVIHNLTHNSNVIATVI